MKFKTTYALKDREGEEKIVRKFLWFPLYFGEEKEQYWLEIADVVYKIKKINVGEYFSKYRWKWRKDRFPTAEDYKKLPFEKPFDDVEDMIRERVTKPHFWLFLDCLAFAVFFYNVKSGVSLLLLLKVMQAAFLSFFRESPR